MDFDKAILWSLLDKYDSIDSYTNFCNSLSRIIQDTFTTYDIVIVYQHLCLIDKEDLVKINVALGDEMDYHLFEIM